jgi:hypothetical protein
MNKIVQVLKEHLPYTFFGVVLATILVFPISRIENINNYKIFYTLHPLHIFLSAYTTASVYKIYVKGSFSFVKLFLIGYIGSILVGTISDSLIPYLSETILKMPYRELHIGFLEQFSLINGVAIFGLILAYIKPVKKISHALHIFISCFASIFHILMSNDVINFSIVFYLGIFVFIFVAVWLPCSFSDLVFPMFFVRDKKTVI